MNRWFILTLVALLVGCGATKQGGGEAVCDCQRAVKVPDKAFRTFLVDSSYAVKVGWQRLKPTAKGCALTTLECYGRGIHSLEGVAMFPQLTSLTCSDNPIEELDLNGLPRLERLYGLNLPLEHLALDSCRHLQRLQLSYTRLTGFDLGPHPELEFLLLIFSPVSALDLTPCPLLTTLYIRGTQIRMLDLRANPAFFVLHALDTPLETLVVTQQQYDGDLKVSCPDSVRIVVR